jgi:hypothetical protein
MNVYIVPIVEVPWGPWPLARVPKYMAPADKFSMLDYGWEPTCLLVTDTVTVSGADVIDLNPLGANVGNTNKMRNDLRAINMPGTWLDNTTTNQHVARVTAAISQVMQRLKGQLPTKQGIFKNNTLNTTWGSLTAEQQQILGDAIAACGYDISWFTATTTIEGMLDYIAAIAKDKPIAVGLMTV